MAVEYSQMEKIKEAASRALIISGIKELIWPIDCPQKTNAKNTLQLKIYKFLKKLRYIKDAY